MVTGMTSDELMSQDTDSDETTTKQFLSA